MKGPDHLFSMIENGPIRFDEYVFGEPVEGKRVTDQEPVEHSRAFKIITLNGLLLPSKGDLEADMMIDRSDPFYRKKRVFYRSKDGKEVMCERSRIKTLSLIFRTTVDLSYIYLRKRGYTRRYSEKALLYRSEKKWKELFKNDE